MEAQVDMNDFEIQAARDLMKNAKRGVEGAD
jgi:hypothetical protein